MTGPSFPTDGGPETGIALKRRCEDSRTDPRRPACRVLDLLRELHLLQSGCCCAVIDPEGANFAEHPAPRFVYLTTNPATNIYKTQTRSDVHAFSASDLTTTFAIEAFGRAVFEPLSAHRRTYYQFQLAACLRFHHVGPASH